jgi:hypothetical protein
MATIKQRRPDLLSNIQTGVNPIAEELPDDIAEKRSGGNHCKFCYLR